MIQHLNFDHSPVTVSDLIQALQHLPCDHELTAYAPDMFDGIPSPDDLTREGKVIIVI